MKKTKKKKTKKRSKTKKTIRKKTARKPAKKKRAKKIIKKTLGKDIVATKPGEIEVIDESVQTFPATDYISVAMERVELLSKLILTALKCTNKNDWVDMHGSPYLCVSGCEKIMRVFGIRMFDLKRHYYERDYSGTKIYFWEYEAKFSLPSSLKHEHLETPEQVIAIGTCSSTDKFFGTKHGSPLPLEIIDETNIMKAALTNCRRNGITTLLGLKNLTWKELKDIGIEQSNIAKVEFKSTKGQTVKPAETKPEKPPIQKPDTTPKADPGNAISIGQKKIIEQNILPSHLLTLFEKFRLEKMLARGATFDYAKKIIDHWIGEKDREREHRGQIEKNTPERLKNYLTTTQDKLMEMYPKDAEEFIAQQVEPSTEKPAPETQPPKENGIQDEQIAAFEQIANSILVQPFEKYIIHQKIANETVTQKQAALMIKEWNDELTKRQELKDKDRKKYYFYVNNMVGKLQEQKPDLYVQYMDDR